MKELKNIEFITEDFNTGSSKAIMVPLFGGKGKTQKQSIFYEEISDSSFNLLRFLASFNSSFAAETLGSNTKMVRGMIFPAQSGNGFIVIIFGDTLLHASVCKALDDPENKKLFPEIPNLQYLKIYNNTALMTKTDKFQKNQWCFPFTYSRTISTNLTTTVLLMMVQQLDILSKFMIPQMVAQQMFSDKY